MKGFVLKGLAMQVAVFFQRLLQVKWVFSCCKRTGDWLFRGFVLGVTGCMLLACSPEPQGSADLENSVKAGSKGSVQSLDGLAQKSELANFQPTKHLRVETPSKDLHSFANVDEVRTAHLHLHLTVDFEGKRLLGYAEHQLDYLESKQPQSAWKKDLKFILDTEELFIERVEGLIGIAGEKGWQPLDFELGEADPVLGTPLIIDVAEQPSKVRVHYASSPQATGLDWVAPEGTAGGKSPFLYSQSQPHYARTWIPIQDTPLVRFTFDGELFTPKNLLGLMGANNGKNQEKTGHYSFASQQAIPSYLMAIAVGDLEFQALDDRVGIYAEPSVLKSAVAEFNYTPDMIAVTEQLFGPYEWDRYDLLILPPSFPFGGMENPQLSFITPTAIAGDQSLVGLIAHELAHSWSGNLVTNETWRDIWLNEGFTSYVENRIMEQVYGLNRAHMERVLDAQALENSIDKLSERYQVLYIDLEQRDPDTAFTRVPYIKAQQFLFFLEGRFGREVFDSFVRQYFSDFAFQSLGTEAFEQYLKEQLLDPHPGLVSEAEVKAWLYEPGLPESPLPEIDLFDLVDEAGVAWLAGKEIDTTGWSIHELLYFLQKMPKELSHSQMKALDQTFRLTQTKNNQLLSRWLVMAIEQNYQPGLERVPEMLHSMGRLVFILPVYQALVQTEEGRAAALEIYQTARAGYHQLTRVEVEAVLE